MKSRNVLKYIHSNRLVVESWERELHEEVDAFRLEITPRDCITSDKNSSRQLVENPSGLKHRLHIVVFQR
jgi:hypothetical protein